MYNVSCSRNGSDVSKTLTTNSFRWGVEDISTLVSNNSVCVVTVLELPALGFFEGGFFMAMFKEAQMKNLWLCFAFLFVFAFDVKAYCTPDNDTCFECGSNCVAELTYTKDENNNNVGTFTVYGTGENGAGQMDSYSYNNASERITTAPWKDKINDINNVVISEGVTNVGGYTFNGAKNLSHLELPQSVNQIGAWAFLYSTLETVNSLKNVTSFGGAAFYYSNLISADLNDNLTAIPSDLFVGTKISSINIPDGVTSIGNYAFSGCDSLEAIEIPDSVKSVGTYALDNIAKIYCNNNGGRCDALLFGEVKTGASEGRVVRYTVDGGYYIHDGQKYRSLENMQNGVGIKRIYTVKEANEASGKKNSVMIRYK